MTSLSFPTSPRRGIRRVPSEEEIAVLIEQLDAPHNMCDLRPAIEALAAMRVDFSDALLYGAKLDGAQLQAASLRNANLSGASLVECNLSFADLTNAVIRTQIAGERAHDLLAELTADERDMLEQQHGWEFVQESEGTGSLLAIRLPPASVRGLNLHRANLRKLERAPDVDMTDVAMAGALGRDELGATARVVDLR
jgi:uncharacterized protein YjbI with pentapeptide repeats